MNEYSGFIKLHRSFRNWEWYEDNNTKCLYLHLILSANYRQDTWKGKTYEIGQVLTSRNVLAEQLGMTGQQVRTALKHLVDTGYITIETTNKFSVITIANWEIYQGGAPSSTYKTTDTKTIQSPAVQPQIKNNINNINIINKECNSAPTRKSKQHSLKVFQPNRPVYEEIQKKARDRLRKKLQMDIAQ